MALLTGSGLFSEPGNGFRCLTLDIQLSKLFPAPTAPKKVHSYQQINDQSSLCSPSTMPLFFAGWMVRGMQTVQNKDWHQCVPISLGLCYRTVMLHGVPHTPSPCVFPMGMHWSTKLHFCQISMAFGRSRHTGVTAHKGTVWPGSHLCNRQNKGHQLLGPHHLSWGFSERQEGVRALCGFAGTTESKRFSKFMSKDKLF